MKRSVIAVVSGGLLALGLAGAAFAAPLKPSPTPTPTVAPYALGQQIITETKTPVSGGLDAGTEIVLTCPAGKVVTGGGFQSYWPIAERHDGAGQPGNPNVNSPIRQSFPSSPNAWTVRFENDNQGAIEPVTGYAVCVNP